MTSNQPKIHVKGIRSPTDHKGPHGTPNPYEEHLSVSVGGTPYEVPVTGVKRAAYDYHGSVPETVTFDRVFLYDGVLHADVVLDDVAVELLPGSDLDKAGSWELHAYPPESMLDYDEMVWARG